MANEIVRKGRLLAVLSLILSSCLLFTSYVDSAEVPESSWVATEGQQVIVERSDSSEVVGRLVKLSANTVTVLKKDGRVVAISRSEVVRLRQEVRQEQERSPPTDSPETAAIAIPQPSAGAAVAPKQQDGILRLSGNVGSVLVVDSTGTKVGTCSEECAIQLPPGQYEIKGASEGKVSVVIASGMTNNIIVSHVNPYFAINFLGYAGIGTGIGLAIGALVGATQKCEPRSGCDSEAQNRKTNELTVAGGVSLALGIVLASVGHETTVFKADTDSTARAVSLSPTVAPSSFGLSLTGQF